MPVPPPEFHGAFVAAGWHESRRVSPDSRIPIDHPAHDLLASFGDLHVLPASETAEECGTSDIDFQFLPECCQNVKDWSSRLGVELVGVAITDEEYGQLWLADDGRYFATNDVTDTFSFVGANCTEMLRNLLNGLWVKPLLAPSSPSVAVYGVTLPRGDSRLYDWQTQILKHSNPTRKTG